MEKAVSKTRIQNLRYERKFVYTHASAQDIIDLEVLTNSFCFSEIFHRRTVNNCYLDDASMSFYHQNVAGDDKRDKYRLRWYGDVFSQINHPVLEIKKKHGAVGDKISFPLNDLSLSLEGKTSHNLLQLTSKTVENNGFVELTSALQLLQPSLYNSYERRYFLSHCKKFRITIDYNMKFYNPIVPNYELTENYLNDVILELKYNREDDKEARLLSQELSKRLSKHSKYVRGVDSVNHLQHI